MSDRDLTKLPTQGRADDDTTDQGRPGGQTAADTRAGADSREVGAAVSEAKPDSEERASGERSARRPPERWDTSDAIIAGHLDIAQRAFDLLFDNKRDESRVDQAMTALVTGWTIAALMETVRRLDPHVADRLARELQDVWDDGAAVSELTYEWRQHLANRRPISTSGRYPTLFDRALGDR